MAFIQCGILAYMKDDQGFWNFIFSVLFLGVFVIAVWYLNTLGKLPRSVALFDFILVILATFRLTRLFVYDKITQFVRDWFLRKEVLEGDDGDLMIVRQKFVDGPRRTLSDLLSCPWCFGVWAGFVVIFFYYATPFAWFPILVLAVAGVATFLQLLSNMIGWRAEELKAHVTEHH